MSEDRFIMFTGKKFSKTLYATILYIAFVGQSIQANPLLAAPCVKIFLACCFIGQNDSFRQNVPMYAKTQDYVMAQAKNGASVTASSALTYLSDVREGFSWKYQIYTNEDTTYLSEPKPSINMTQELAEVNPKGTILRQSDKTLSNRGADFLNKITGKYFQCEERKNAEYVVVDIHEKSPILKDGEVFYDAHEPVDNHTVPQYQTPEAKYQTSKENSSSANSYWKYLPTGLFSF